MTTIENYLTLINNKQYIYNPPALKALQHGMKIPSYAPLVMQNVALTAHLAQVYATTAKAFHPATSAVAMQNTFLQLERFIPTVIMSPVVSNMSAILPALEYLRTEHPDSYQQVDSILSVEMDKDGSIEQYIQELLSKLKDTIPVTNSNLPQYLFILEQSLDIILPFIDEPLKTSVEQLRSLIIILAYIIFENIPKCK